MSTLDEELKHPLNSRMFTCPVQGKWTSFQLVNEMGEGHLTPVLPMRLLIRRAIHIKANLTPLAQAKLRTTLRAQ